MPNEVIYIVERFPSYSETFIHDEIANHLKSGLQVRVIVLTGPGLSGYPISKCSKAIQERTNYLSVPASKVGIVISGLVAAIRGRHLKLLIKATLQSGLSIRELMLGSIIAAQAPEEAILHCHFGNIGRIGLAVQTLSSNRKSLFVTFHAHEMTRSWFLPLERYYAPLFRSDATLLPICEHWRMTLIGAGADPKRIAVHHMGVKLVAAPQTSLGEEDQSNLVMVGRMVETKGHVDVVEAILRLKNRGLTVTCDFVGGGPCEDRLRNLIRAYGLGDEIRMHGPLPHAETLRIMEAAHIFLLPSVTAPDGDKEGIPVSLMEAMARNIPVISTFHSGIPELIEDGVSGLLVPEHKPEQLADAIEKLVRDPALRKRLAEAGRVQVEEKFNSARQTDLLQRRYQSGSTQSLC